MAIAAVVALFMLATACGEEVRVRPLDALANTDLVLAFVIFRHGDRTPEDVELQLYDSSIDNRIFFPYGTKALTNRGKQRAYRVGQYIRRRYDKLLSKLYLPDEIKIRSTAYDRTKMTALAALAAIYPPPPAQRWNPLLNWQPVPYDSMPAEDDNLLNWYSCPLYWTERDRVYNLPEVQAAIKPYRSLFSYLTEKTGSNINTTQEVFYLDGLYQALANVNIETPEWAKQVMPQIKAVTKLEFAIQFYNDDLIRLTSGVLLHDIVDATNSAIAGDLNQPRVRLYSAHDISVAALLAAARVFTPHQPNYGSTFSIELRRHRVTGQYGITTVYAPSTDRPEVILNVKGCGGGPFCDYETFLNLTANVSTTEEDFKNQCSV